MRPHIARAQKLPLAGLMLCVLGLNLNGSRVALASRQLGDRRGAFLGYLIVSSTFPVADCCDPQNWVYGNGVCNW